MAFPRSASERTFKRLAPASDVIHIAAASTWVGGLGFMILALLLAGADRWPLASRAVPRFSILAVIWRPGQLTRIHDHTTWCVFGVIQGVEHEELYDADLNLLGRSDNQTGEVSGFAPPGDIHRVHNTSDTTAISIHIYGTDVTRIGSSVRRYYD